MTNHELAEALMEGREMDYINRAALMDGGDENA